MSKPKLGPWHPASVKPVHVGVYMVEDPFKLVLYKKWDGKYWHVADTSPKVASMWASYSNYASRWRGLAEKPA